MVLPSGFTAGIEGLVGARVQRDQLDIEVAEDLERAVEPGLIGHPPDQVWSCRRSTRLTSNPSMAATRVGLSVPLTSISIRSRTQFDSFRRHDGLRARMVMWDITPPRWAWIDARRRGKHCRSSWDCPAPAHHPNRVITLRDPSGPRRRIPSMAVAGRRWHTGVLGGEGAGDAGMKTPSQPAHVVDRPGLRGGNWTPSSITASP